MAKKSKPKKLKFEIVKHSGTVKIFSEVPGTMDPWNFNRPHRISCGQISFNSLLGCCGIKEICNFFTARRLGKDDKIKVVKEIAKSVDRCKQGIFLANFVKIGKAKKYQDQDFMEELLNVGFQKLGEPHYNRRYKRHLIQTLLYRHPKSEVQDLDTVVPPVIGA